MNQSENMEELTQEIGILQISKLRGENRSFYRACTFDFDV